MRIELLGTGGYFANDRRQTACLLLPELGLAFDGGSALFRISDRLQTPELKLFLTHAHLDHIVGLPYLLMPVHSKQVQRIAVHATQATLDAVKTHLFATPVFPVPVPFSCEEITSPGSMNIASDVTLRWQALPSHPGGSMAYRIDVTDGDGQRSMAYVTDTSLDGSYTDFIRGVDLLIHECYFSDEKAHLAARTGHCSASEVARLAVEAEVGRMVIVHVDPTIPLEDPVGVEGMRQIFPQTTLGYDGLSLEF
ncbi:MBL fold metallo-hydrolase [Planctomicrobium piriforme]|uniref:Ribonuclease BN, tRNA processing enzyme n=1 Tax=Planctomicrobium piriforme TaxID=1576369 RepID=A0A1I3HJ34_9PLAN|nr:MBL fold metallo-hydrolase [Planctomicrobium piriforme]SFI35745.1 Ribonuclease BN, tRNA processing enzyme [Planctomicrobium piriforme]